MIIVLKRNITEKDKNNIIDFLQSRSFRVKEIVGEEESILGAVGHNGLDPRQLELMGGVAKVIPISKPYKLASREFKKSDTIFNVGPVTVGGNRVTVIAGPCAVESKEQIIESAYAVKKAGAVMLRGGAFKPRTSPYSFQGLQEKGCQYLKEASELTGLPVVTEIVAPGDADMMKDYVDVFQIGARNMQNFELLKTVGRIGKPVVLKRGMSATIEEWLMAAEYLMSEGNDNIILCERGIRTYENFTRNTLDISAVPIIQQLSHLPVIVDPSHATGLRDKVSPMALAAIAAGANGLVVEVHPDPDKALSDGPQSLYPEQFEKLMCDIKELAPVMDKELTTLPKEKSVIELSERTESHIGAAFQGVRGAYSEMAVYNYYGKDVGFPLPQKSFKDVFNSVLDGSADSGLIPLENSLAGSINENYDLLKNYSDLCITGEVKVRVSHALIGTIDSEISDIKEVYSHPQALAQSSVFIEKNKMTPISYYDTAGAVKDISEKSDKTKGAIASSVSAEIYGMKILKEGIETHPGNYTRFAVIQRRDRAVDVDWNKASMVFNIKDEQGALSKYLSIFNKYNLNMTKIESRPVHGKPWSYTFYIDVTFDGDKEIFNQIERELSNQADDFRLLGLYQACK
ncbi:3-deoxy-7-phosphoheptulonate synthase [Thiospirochaeta perfilievii]|uniref:Prephenate dehydratase n=1 Tax=Thiospirochaeta perfilievii TaxID=252967 RepID=A0A5C1QBR4_9SPIO|nr:3-deoxy-7-phosphoheptulonate synthase [Thiospirochaeta perfilievii]QEN04828.1 3-deoxy-7-phosphoheptulonate synthase [Thiospirochaeta perfilievii]